MVVGEVAKGGGGLGCHVSPSSFQPFWNCAPGSLCRRVPRCPSSSVLDPKRPPFSGHLMSARPE